MSGLFIIKILFATTILLVIFGCFLVFFIVYMRNKQNIFFLEKQRFQNGRIEEAERIQNEVAKEVHDNILQIASLMQTHLHSLKDTIASEAQAETIRNIAELNTLIMDDARKICFSLNSDYIRSHSLYAILQDELNRILKTKKITYSIEVKGIARMLNVDLKTMIFRIATEAVMNVIKHSGATQIGLIFDFREKHFYLSITDNGLGFAKEALLSGDARGLSFMQQRAQLLNAELNIESSPGSGCSVTLLCPT